MVKGSREDFLSRWSSRKQKAREETELDAAAEREDAELSGTAPVDGPGATEAAELSSEPEKSDEEILQEFGLPHPESLMKGDSIAGFLKAGVPMRLRNRALRRLWLTDPVFANLDGLNDYEEDFTDAATVVKGMRTAYRPGRGFLRDDPAPETFDAEAMEGDTERRAEAEGLAAPGEIPPAEAESAAGETADEQTGDTDHGSASAESGAISPEKADCADRAGDMSEDSARTEDSPNTEDDAGTGDRLATADPEQASEKNDHRDDESGAIDQGAPERFVRPHRMQFHFDTE